MEDQAVDTIVHAAASKATYSGAGVSALSWMMTSEGGVVAGIVIALVGLVVNIIFKIRDDRRKAALYEAQMRGLESGKS